MNTKEESGRRIKAARKNKGMRLEDVCSHMPGLTVSRLSNWEQGRNMIGVEEAKKISPILGVSASHLLTLDEEKSHPRAQEEPRGYLNLNHDEQALVNWYRHTSAEARKLLHGVMQLAPIPTHDAQQAPGLSEGARSILASHEQANEKLARAAQQLTRKTPKTKTQEKP